MEIQKQMNFITSPELTQIISEGLAEIYNNHPKFPITYLANWLHSYSSSEQRKKQLISLKSMKQKKYQMIRNQKISLQLHQRNQKQQIEKQNQQKQRIYQTKIIQTKHLQDLLQQWLPQSIEKEYLMAGAYVGKLDFNKKYIEEGNFQVGTENDTENPKIITYVGASNSHQSLMIGATLPAGKGISYDIFEEKPQQSNEQGGQVNAQQKKTFIYVADVMKQPRLYYFRYPKLGSYACYPMKIKSCLNITTLDKGIADYKAYLKTKEETEKQYHEKLSEAKTEAEQASKKFQDFEVNEQDPSSHEQKKILEEQAKNTYEKFQQFSNNPPIIEEVKFDTTLKTYFLGVDRLGQDKPMSNEILQGISKKVSFFVLEWQKKQQKMLLADILAYLQQQVQLQQSENILQQHEKNLVNSYQSQIKQQFINRQKQAQYEFSLIKCQKTRLIFHQTQLKISMNIYLNYNVPKFTEIIQIWCMILGMPKNDINIKQSNQLDHRRLINSFSFKDLLSRLQKYELRRQYSVNVSTDYKICKLLERLQKIQPDTLVKYNKFLFILHYLLKNYCWTRILGRDAKKELFQIKSKLKQDRDNQIQKWLTQIQKNLEIAKAQLDEERLQNFKQQDWRKNYQTQNPKPQPLEDPVLNEFLDIE